MYGMVTRIFTLLGEMSNMKKTGTFTNHYHGIGGTVYTKGKNMLIIKGFTYDGTGPDVFFLVGTQGSPSDSGTILSYPYKGKHYEYNDENAPTLKEKFSGNMEVRLVLPPALTVMNIKWISVWCREFSVNFGDVIFTLETAS